jgi:nucleoside 2-deoxyribosyltransferase
LKTKAKERMSRPKIYIASPYTIGDVAVNVRNQIEAADQLIEHGFAPFAPLYSHFQHMIYPRPYEQWMELDLIWLPACDAVLRLPGESKGADVEVKKAEELGIPVFATLYDVITYFETK